MAASRLLAKVDVADDGGEEAAADRKHQNVKHDNAFP
jgi:hypothetical protein